MGPILSKSVFGWPGMGRLGVSSILQRDYPVVMGVTMLSALLVISGNLIADVCYALIDPHPPVIKGKTYVGNEQQNAKFFEASPHAPTTQLGLVWRQFRRHRLAVVGVVFLMILMVGALFGRWIMPYDPLQQNPLLARGMPQPPSSQHLLGTDAFGRETYSPGLISGAQISLSVGFVAVGISLLIGISLGSMAGFYGGWVDNFNYTFGRRLLVGAIFLPDDDRQRLSKGKHIQCDDHHRFV